MYTNKRKWLALVSLFIFFLAGSGMLFNWATAVAQDKDKKKPAADEPAARDKEKAGSEQEPRPKGSTSIAVEVKVVNVEVTVTDKKGNLITGLRQNNFTVYEDNVKQEITNFSPIEAPITVVLVVDYSKIAYRLGWSYFGNDIWDAVYEFARTLRKEDWAAVVAYDMRPEILADFTQDRSKIYAALRRLNIPAFSEANLSDALVFVLDRVDEIEGKVAVILVSSGLDTFSKVTYDTALKKSRDSGAVIYSVGIGQNRRLRNEPYIPAEVNIDFLQADNRLRSFADYSGGLAYFPRFVSEFRGIFGDISGRLRHMYSIGYVPSNKKKDGKFRKIKVEVNADIDGDGKPDKLNLTYRKGYNAPKG